MLVYENCALSPILTNCFAFGFSAPVPAHRIALARRLFAHFPAGRLPCLRPRIANAPSSPAQSTVGRGSQPAHQVRQLACEADIIPAVLGEAGEILDLGRAKRLVTPGQRRALAHRDGGCSFPGCHVPATWCDAHHVVHWAQGGRSDLGNYALLCPRHHSWVHQHDTTADVHATGVRWRLR